jgi:hypothetical protein
MTQSCVTALVNGTTINCELRLVLSHLWVSDVRHSYVTPHLNTRRIVEPRPLYQPIMEKEVLA